MSKGGLCKNTIFKAIIIGTRHHTNFTGCCLCETMVQDSDPVIDFSVNAKKRLQEPVPAYLKFGGRVWAPTPASLAVWARSSSAIRRQWRR